MSRAVSLRVRSIHVDARRKSSIARTIFCILVAYTACLLLSSSTNAQSATPPLERIVTIAFQNERTDAALKKLSQQAGFTFSYSISAFDTQKTITKSFNKKTVREILEELFDGQVKYKQKNNYIILTKAEGSEGVVVSGYVVDEATGQKLKEVSVYDPVSLKSAVTDEFGFFELELNKPTKEQLQLAIKKSNYTDTLVTVPARRSTFQNLSLNVDKEKWKAFSDSLDSKLNRLWSWTKQSAQRINMRNIRDTINRTWQVSFLPFVGTNHKLSGNVVNDYSLNILGGYSAGTRVLEVGGLFNINRGDVRYAQVAGLFNLNGGYTQGAQFAGLLNTNLDSARAVQFAGLVNSNSKSSEGAQFAGLINVNVGDYKGPQFAGLFNTTLGNVAGVQAAGLFNVTWRTTQGAQVAGVLNAAREVTGSQVSGLINVAKTVQGTQVGVFNIADSVYGVPVGFLSFVNKGYHKIEVAVDDVLPVNISFRTGVRQFHNIITVGVHPQRSDTITWAFGYGVGTAPKLNRWLSLNADVTANQLIDGNIAALNLINKLQVGCDFHIAKKFSVFAGGTLNLRVYDADFTRHAETAFSYTNRVLGEGSFSRKTNYQLWFGGKVGVRFL